MYIHIHLCIYTYIYIYITLATSGRAPESFRDSPLGPDNLAHVENVKRQFKRRESSQKVIVIWGFLITASVKECTPPEQKTRGKRQGKKQQRNKHWNATVQQTGATLKCNRNNTEEQTLKCSRNNLEEQTLKRDRNHRSDVEMQQTSDRQPYGIGVREENSPPEQNTWEGPPIRILPLRPISLLTLSLLRLLDSNFPGNPLTDMRIPPLRVKILLESKPLKSINLVARLAIHPVSITRFPLTRFSPGSGLLRNRFLL